MRMKHLAKDKMMFKTLNLDFPTHPSNYVQEGMPLNWQNCATFSMQQAVIAYLNQTPSEHELNMVIAYMKHHIHAPCWLEQSPFGEVDEATAAEIRALRERSLQMKTVEDVNAYIQAALAVGLDPL